MVFLQLLKILILSREIYNYDLVPEKYKLKNGRLVKEGVCDRQSSWLTGHTEVRRSLIVAKTRIRFQKL